MQTVLFPPFYLSLHSEQDNTPKENQTDVGMFPPPQALCFLSPLHVLRNEKRKEKFMLV